MKNSDWILDNFNTLNVVSLLLVFIVWGCEKKPQTTTTEPEKPVVMKTESGAIVSTVHDPVHSVTCWILHDGRYTDTSLFCMYDGNITHYAH